MARPLRIEFPGAIYHVTSRGDRREPIFIDDQDRLNFIHLMALALERCDASVLAYCLMGNHYHLVLQTRRANLSVLMRQVNGVYTKRFNHRHGKAGHVFQGRFKAILVDRKAYLLEVCRYVEINPLRAQMVSDLQHWPWSSLAAHVGQTEAPPWLDVAALHEQLMGRPMANARDVRTACSRYARLVASAPDTSLWETALRGQVFLGDEAFVDRMLAKASPAQRAAREIPKSQRSKPKSLKHWLAHCDSRDEAFFRANRDSGMSMTAIGAEAGLTVARVSQIIAAWNRDTSQNLILKT